MNKTNVTTLPSSNKWDAEVDNSQLKTFLETRFYPPKGEGEYVIRESVEKMIQNITTHRLVLVKAPAGYGKTTSISSCYWSIKKSDGVVAWLNLTDFSGSFTEFARYITQAFSWQVAKQSTSSKKWGNSNWFNNPTMDSLSIALCNSANNYAKPAYLFLDDFDAIVGTDAELFIYQLLREAPKNLHFILAGRTAPSFGLGRMRMQGLLVEVGVEELRFSQKDAALLLGATGKTDDENSLVSTAVNKTEGWPAALRLVAISLNHGEQVQNLLNSFNGEIQQIGEFLAEDVLEKLEPSFKEFLLKTSILKRFSVPLCNAITGRNDSRAIIDELERRSLFICSLDDDKKWYRYHASFSTFLYRNLKELQPDLIDTLNIKASNWFDGEGLTIQAVDYALEASDYSRAADILELHSNEILSRGLFDTLYNLLNKLPSNILETYPSLRLWQVQYLIGDRKFNQAEKLLTKVEAYVNSALANMSDSDKKTAINNSLLQTKLILAELSDDMFVLEDLCKKMLVEPNTYSASLTGVLHSSFLHSQREQYRLDEVEKRRAMANKALLNSEQPLMVTGLEVILGPTYMQRGEFDSAEQSLRRGIALTEQTENPMMCTGISALLGELLLERGEIDEARRHFDFETASVKATGFVEILLASYVSKARLALFDGDNETADSLLREGVDFGISQSLKRLRWYCIDERIRQHLRSKDIWGALRIASDSGLPGTDDKLYPVGKFTTTREAKAMAWARTALADGRPKDALKLMKKWLNFVVSQRCVRSQIRISILLAQIYQAMGEIRSALRILKIMPHIAKSGMLFCLIEEGDTLRGLIMQVCEIESDDNVNDISFSLRVKQAIESQTERNLLNNTQPILEVEDIQCEALNTKEIEILKLVSRSMRNKEIADNLGLTEGTVKWYLQQIYDKFDVRRRFAALERARALGYL